MNLALSQAPDDLPPASPAAGLLRTLLPTTVQVAAADPCAPVPPLPGVEAAAVAGAVERRRREFAAGRSAARAALVALGQPPFPIPMAADRAPVWPGGIAGSITHSAGACVAAVAEARLHRSVAVDLEPDAELDAALIDTVLTPAERAALEGRPDRLALALVIFSAKECVYKAQYPLTGLLLDFQQVEVTLDLLSGGFVGVLSEDVPLAPADRVMAGRWLRGAGLIATAIALGPPAPAPAEAPSETGPAPARITHPYLLISPIPYFEDPDGGVWIDPLWHRDLIAHLDHLADLRVAAPRGPFTSEEGLVRVAAPPPGTRLAFVPLPPVDGLAAALRRLPATTLALARAVRAAAVVHSGAAGWPLPLGAIANPLAVLFGKPLVVVIESAFWRPAPGSAPGLKLRLRATLVEALARWSVRRAALSVLTTEDYRRTLAMGARGEILIAPATWIGDADILPDDVAAAAWAAKPVRPRFAFAGRLTPEKGVGVLLAALEILEARGTALDIDIIGVGAMAEACRAVAARLDRIRLTVHDPVDYGPAFFGFLRARHAVLVPTLTDEQPRILFDAFSQAVPVIASGTGGHLGSVQPGENGWLVPPGEPEALAAALARAAADPQDLARMGLAALATARTRTHEAMHRTRAALLRRVLGGG